MKIMLSSGLEIEAISVSDVVECIAQKCMLPPEKFVHGEDGRVLSIGELDDVFARTTRTVPERGRALHPNPYRDPHYGYPVGPYRSEWWCVVFQDRWVEGHEYPFDWDVYDELVVQSRKNMRPYVRAALAQPRDPHVTL